MRLEAKDVLALFQESGVLNQNIKGFESRKEQQDMLVDVVEAFNENKVALIEAGTGTGKSIAYLLPAIMWAIKNNEPIVISTNTINLQEQLLNKDIPMLKQALNLNIKAVLVKGMGNYLCKRKLFDIQGDAGLLSFEDQEQLDFIAAWDRKTKDGSRSSLKIMPSYSIWERVNVEGEACSYKKCPFYKDCFFMRARHCASNAKILLVNHHLLFADLVLKASVPEKEKKEVHGILPYYDRLIIDEAHNIESVATEYFASSISEHALNRLLTKLTSEPSPKFPGKLFILKSKINKAFPKGGDNDIKAFLGRIDIDIAGERRQLLEASREAFRSFFSYYLLLSQKENNNKDGMKFRIREQHFKQEYWLSEVLPTFQNLLTLLRSFAHSLLALSSEIKNMGKKGLKEKVSDTLLDIQSLAVRIKDTADAVKKFALDEDHIQNVRWIEIFSKRGIEQLSLHCAKLDIAKILSKELFQRFSTVLLCSATLSTGDNFEFIKQRYGITEKELPKRKFIEKIYDSPFNYQKQVLVTIPRDVPPPNHSNYLESVCEKIWDAVHASRGNTFVLFTSFHMLNACYQRLITRLKKGRYHTFKQGQDHRQNLINKFKDSNYSVLFGTDSFWEGVDVTGDSLRCVVIVKLPFQVPTEPVIQARTEAISANGGNPFMEYSIPTAIVKFKQGIGRLIRKKTDRGCIVCLDSRILNKQYGHFFLKSLPKCTQHFEKGEAFFKAMEEFYKKTYYLVEKEGKNWSVTESNR